MRLRLSREVSRSYGYPRELHRANRRHGVMSWRSAEFARIGPLVRAREITERGLGRWESVAVAVFPERYIARVAVEGDVVRGEMR